MRFIIIAIVKQSKVLAISLPAVLRRTVLHCKKYYSFNAECKGVNKNANSFVELNAM